MSQLQERTLNIILLGVIALLAITELGFGDPPPAVYRNEIYTVRSGDTLWTIAETYIQKNTYGPREIREFYYGIIEVYRLRERWRKRLNGLKEILKSMKKRKNRPERAVTTNSPSSIVTQAIPYIK